VEPVAAAVHDAAELYREIEHFARTPNGALLVLPDLFTATHRQSIIALTAHHRLPAVYPFRYFVTSGGLMSYGIEMLETYRQAASYVDRILKGERPFATDAVEVAARIAAKASLWSPTSAHRNRKGLKSCRQMC
jgi:putative ABC transport system substrate-binding protein